MHGLGQRDNVTESSSLENLGDHFFYYVILGLEDAINVNFTDTSLSKKQGLVSKSLSLFSKNLRLFSKTLHLFSKKLCLFSKYLSLFSKRLSLHIYLVKSKSYY